MAFFVEKVLIPLGVAVVGAIFLTNPMKFDWTQRITLGAAVLLFLFFLGYTANQANQRGANQKVSEVPQTQPAPAVPPISQTANVSSCSNVVAGNDVTIKCPQSEDGNAKKRASTKPVPKKH